MKRVVARDNPMSRRALCRALACSALLLLTVSAGPAPSPAVEPTSTSSAQWPGTVTVTAGDVRTRIEAAKMWTISGLEYQDTVMAVQDSAYGTVLTIRGVGHLGTAHFLDVPGRPGAVEKENVTSLKLFVDDKPLTPFAPTMKAGGKSFRMERKSSIRGLKLESTVSIRDGVVTETARLHATEPIDLQKAHPTMYAFTPQATVYAFGNDTGIQKRGVFAKAGGTDVKTEKAARWMALFDPASGKGSVCYLVKHPPDAGADGWFLLIDAPGVYRKLALYTFVDQVVPKGFDGTYQTAVGFFSATEADWETQALKRARELKSSSTGQSKL
jgi:hypothetical protein